MKYIAIAQDAEGTTDTFDVEAPSIRAAWEEYSGHAGQTLILTTEQAKEVRDNLSRLTLNA